MELSKPVELARDTLGMVTRAGRCALTQLRGGAWAELADKYGEEMGGHKPHPASIQIYSTPEIPDNIQVGTE